MWGRLGAMWKPPGLKKRNDAIPNTGEALLRLEIPTTFFVMPDAAWNEPWKCGLVPNL